MENIFCKFKLIKVGLSPSKKVSLICFDQSTLKYFLFHMKSSFRFQVIKLFNFLSWLF